MTKICAISDTHLNHWNITIPDCDIFIHAGDSNCRTITELIDFNNWIKQINAKFKIYVAGNHCSICEKLNINEIKNYLQDCIYLENETLIIDNIKFFGSPYSKEFNGWSFMAYEHKLKEIWDKIPEDTDIVITHGPAYGWLDQNVHGEHCGSETLRARFEEIKPKYHITGHLHEASNILQTEYTTIINASVLDENYKLKFQPKVFYFEK